MTIQDILNVTPEDFAAIFTQTVSLNTTDTALELADKVVQCPTICDAWATSMIAAVATGVIDDPRSVILTAFVAGLYMAVNISQNTPENDTPVPTDLLSFLESHIKTPEEI